MRRIALLEVLDDTQCVKIVVEPAPMVAKASIERSLSGMAEGRMSDIVNQRQRLGQIFVQAKSHSAQPGNLRNLHRMGQPTAKVVRRPAGKDLRFAGKTTEGTSLHNPFPITLKWSPQGTNRRRIGALRQRIVRSLDDRIAMQFDRHGQVRV
jgi:hypothetical protein